MKSIPIMTFFIEGLVAVILAIFVTFKTHKTLLAEKYYTVTLENGYEGEHD